jgi:hypothetical protein
MFAGAARVRSLSWSRRSCSSSWSEWSCDRPAHRRPAPGCHRHRPRRPRSSQVLEPGGEPPRKGLKIFRQPSGRGSQHMIVNVVGERAGQVGLVEGLSEPVVDPGSYGGSSAMMFIDPRFSSLLESGTGARRCQRAGPVSAGSERSCVGGESRTVGPAVSEIAEGSREVAYSCPQVGTGGRS